MGQPRRTDRAFLKTFDNAYQCISRFEIGQLNLVSEPPKSSAFVPRELEIGS